MTRIKFFVVITMMFGFSNNLLSQEDKWQSKFEQLGSALPSPNIYRSGDGAPGPNYWQQKADYKISVTLDESKRKVSGTQTVRYKNNSPQTLEYLWLQLDQNRRAPHNQEKLSSVLNLPDTIPSWAYMYYMKERTTENGIHIKEVSDKDGKTLIYDIVNTMLRIDLPEGLEPGKSVEFSMSWWYNLNNRMEDRGRSGFEHFPERGYFCMRFANQDFQREACGKGRCSVGIHFLGFAIRIWSFLCCGRRRKGGDSFRF